MPNAGEEVEKLIYITGGNLKGYGHSEKVWQSFLMFQLLQFELEQSNLILKGMDYDFREKIYSNNKNW